MSESNPTAIVSLHPSITPSVVGFIQLELHAHRRGRQTSIRPMHSSSTPSFATLKTSDWTTSGATKANETIHFARTHHLHRLPSHVNVAMAHDYAVDTVGSIYRNKLGCH